MSAVITYSGGTITPRTLGGYEARRAVGNKRHPVLGSEDVDFTYRPSKRRRGTLTLVFETVDTALSAFNAHATGTTFTLTHSTVPEADMAYSVDEGELAMQRGDGGDWVITVPYQELAP